jgi:hypothetical protein
MGRFPPLRMVFKGGFHSQNTLFLPYSKCSDEGGGGPTPGLSPPPLDPPMLQSNV